MTSDDNMVDSNGMNEDGDFGDINLDDFELPEIDLRFDFLEDNLWPVLTAANYAPNTIKKMRYVEKIFNDWKRTRNSQSESK